MAFNPEEGDQAPDEVQPLLQENARPRSTSSLSSVTRLSGKAELKSDLTLTDHEIEQERQRQLGLNQQTEFEKKPWKLKLIAFVCSCLLSVGSHYAANMLGALKGTLKEELGISNAQYGLLQSAVSLVNTVMPFFGGIFIDVFGTGIGSILASSLIFFGDAIVATSTHLESFPVMVVGRVTYGIGSGCIVTVQEAILAHWFKGKSLAITLGCQIAMSRLSNFLATGTVVPIAEATGFYGNAFWVSTAICGFSWIMTLIYVWLLWYIGEDKNLKDLEKKMTKKATFRLDAVYSFPTIFWIIAFMSFALGTCWGPFLHISPELIKYNFGSGDAEAAWESTAGLLIPIIVSPFLGYIIDRWGLRSWITIAAGALLIPSFYLLGFTMVTPMLGLVIFSFSYTFGPVSLISSIPLVLDVGVIGTALGIYKCASNIGATISDPLIGYVQDAFDSYDQVMMIMLLFAIISTVGSIVAFLVDRYSLQSLLNLTSQARQALFGPKTPDEIAPKASRCATYVYLAITFTLLLASWGVYIALVIISQNF